MATLEDIAKLYSRGGVDANRINGLIDKIKARVLLKAEVIRLESAATPDHEKRLIWATEAFIDATAKADKLWGAVLAQNSGATVNQILDALDPAITTAVDAAIESFLTLPIVP